MRVLRITALLLLALLAWLQYRLWFGHGGAGDVRELSQQVEQQRRDNGGLQQRNDALAAEVAELKSEDGGAAVEERARSELGLIKPGETFHRVVEPAPTPPAEDARREEAPCSPRTRPRAGPGPWCPRPGAAPVSAGTCPSKAWRWPANRCWRIRCARCAGTRRCRARWSCWQTATNAGRAGTSSPASRCAPARA